MTEENIFIYFFAILLIAVFLAVFITYLMLRSKYISRKEVNEQYVSKEVHTTLRDQADILEANLHEKEEEYRVLSVKNATNEQQIIHLKEKFAEQATNFEQLKEQSKIEFENLANRLFDEKTRVFSDKNQRQLQDILNPLKEKIKDFESGIEKRFIEDTKDKVSLKKEIEQLKDLNLQLSADANNLAKALVGDSKTQGNWGEFQLEMLLEKSGLQKGIHFIAQPSYKDENGKDKRPDFIINMPDNKHLVIDSKVSLTAYNNFYKATTEKEQKLYLKAHIASIRNHIKELAAKNYQHLYDIESPDYLLMFIPIEPAFSTAIQKDNHLFLDALEKNIVLVSTTTLLATMRTVSYIWKQEKQKKSVIEIARQSGMLYDKFVNFIDDLKNVGNKLKNAQDAYADAMNKLTDSKKFGDTLIGRAQKIKELGAKASKELPRDLL